MNILTNIISELTSIDKNWLAYLNPDKNMNNSQNQKLFLKISELLSLLKTMYIEDPKNCLSQIDTLFNEETEAETIKKYLSKILVYYQNTIHMRELEKSDANLCKEFIRFIMENYIVRISKNIQENFKVYQFENDADFLETARALDSLTEYYVKKTFATATIAADFQSETALSENTCQFYAELVNQYYTDIRFNIIINNTEFLCSHIEKH